MAFVHLHLHTIYSFLDGLNRPKRLMKEVRNLGMKAVAITDHGNMHGVVEFYTAAKSEGIKPIIGMEAYIAAGSRKERVSQQDAYHLVLLATNQTGYQNLMYLTTCSYLDGFYYKPRIDRELLKDHAEGLIATSACLAGEIPRALAEGNKKKALHLAGEYREMFGRDNFFIELQVNGLKEQDDVNPLLLEVGKELHLPFVATNDVHYLLPEHATAQDILFCINEKKRVEDTDRMHHESREFYLKGEEAMRELFTPLCLEAVENTGYIAERCTFEMEIGKVHLPHYDTGTVPMEQFLREAARRGLEERFRDGRLPEKDRPIYEKRLNDELDIIITKGYAGYFLIVSDFIGWAKKNGVPVGPGRGSGAGSLVAFCLDVTEIDPVPYRLFFERFLNPERPSMPDFDVDFCKDKRGKVIEYVAQKYGPDHVAQIATYTKMKAKLAVRDVARVLGIDLQTADRLAKMVPETFDMLLRPHRAYDPQKGKDNRSLFEHLQKKYRIPEEISEDCDRVKEHLAALKPEQSDVPAVKALLADIELFEKERAVIRDDESYRRIVEVADQIEGLLRQTGKHAAGVVISDKPIWERAPIFVDKDGSRVVQYDKDMVEKIGLVKFDFLGLKTLTMIQNAVELIRQREPDFDIRRIPLDDPATFRTFWAKSAKGIFQMDSAGFGKMIRQMRPDRIEDLIAAVALYRPGPMASIPSYIRRKHGRESVVYEHPLLEEILRETYGLIVYQEQVMQIAVTMAGFSLGHADLLRKAMGKKQADAMAKAEFDFMKGATARGIAPEVAARIFDLMRRFAEYGFNKSHAAAYGVLGYRTAYLKTHYPYEFFAALISSEAGDTAKMIEYIADARSFNIEIRPPAINQSGLSFSIEEGGIRFGLGAIKNIGEAAIEEIIVERQKNGPFRSLLDFASRVNQSRVNARAMEFLVKGGAFDFTGINRAHLLAILPAVLREGEKRMKDRLAGQTSLFALMNSASLEHDGPVRDDPFVQQIASSIPPWDVFQTLDAEREVLGVYLTGHPAHYFSCDVAGLGLSEIEDFLAAAEEGDERVGRQKVRVLGMITTDIKPQKGRDGDYFLRGVIEGHNAAVSFTINGIEQAASPVIEKLRNPLPLIFTVTPRLVRNDEGGIDRIEAAINNPSTEVMTITAYLAAEAQGRCGLLIEADAPLVAVAKEDIAALLESGIPAAIELPVTVKVRYPEKKMAAYLQRTGWITEERLRRLKSRFGPDGCRFYRCAGAQQPQNGQQ